MTIGIRLSRLLPLASAAPLLLLASCAVDREASMFRGGPAAGAEAVPASRSGFFGASRMAERERVEWLRAEEARRAELARAQAREMAEQAAQARRREAERAADFAEMREWEAIAAANKRDREARRAAKRAEGRGFPFRPFGGGGGVRQEAPAYELVSMQPAARERGGFFSRPLFGGKPKRPGSGAPAIFVDHGQVHALEPSNAEIEISLAEQRARVFRKQGADKVLVIETPVSTGKSGFETPTGSFRIGEKKEEKQSTLYGIWYDAAGQPVPSNGESAQRPPGGVRFVGAEMPYWLRLVDGIGMHIGEVPGVPASHGCIRVPASIQPLIFSKVGVGTPVKVDY